MRNSKDSQVTPYEVFLRHPRTGREIEPTAVLAGTLIPTKSSCRFGQMSPPLVSSCLRTQELLLGMLECPGEMIECFDPCERKDENAKRPTWTTLYNLI